MHISELPWKRVGSTGEVLKVGEVKDFKVLEVDQKRKRVSLSLKALEQKPESLRKAEVEEDLPARKPNLNLKGGMGGNAPGGLFGNPTDFTSQACLTQRQRQGRPDRTAADIRSNSGFRCRNNSSAN